MQISIAKLNNCIILIPWNKDEQKRAEYPKKKKGALNALNVCTWKLHMMRETVGGSEGQRKGHGGFCKGGRGGTET